MAEFENQIDTEVDSINPKNGGEDFAIESDSPIRTYCDDQPMFLNPFLNHLFIHMMTWNSICSMNTKKNYI